MVAADLGRVVLVLGFLLVRSPETVWIAYVLLAGVATLAAAFEPASAAALPNLVEPEDLGIANALSGSLWGTMLAIGAAVGGVVTAAFGRDVAIVVDAVSFAASASLIAGVRRPLTLERTEHASIREATLETVRYARRDHRVLALVMVKFGWGLGGGVLVLIPIVASRFGAGEVAIGLLMAARGIGALVGPFAGRAAIGAGERRLFGVIGVALAVFGLGYGLLGLAPSILLAMGAVALAHVGGGAQWTLSSYGLQKIVPDRIRGRIFAFDGMLVTLTFGLSSLATGWLAERYGASTTALAMGAITLLWAAGWSWMTTDVRRPLV
jgi:MFS family permease